MTADLLRRAAAHIRDVAESATRGPWIETASKYPDGTYRDHVTSERDLELDVCEVPRTPQGSEDARHIALWSPNVALVIADWLDGSASDLEYGGTLSSCDAPGVVQYHIDFARRILGEQP